MGHNSLPPLGRSAGVTGGLGLHDGENAPARRPRSSPSDRIVLRSPARNSTLLRRTPFGAVGGSGPLPMGLARLRLGRPPRQDGFGLGRVLVDPVDGLPRQASVAGDS